MGVLEQVRAYVIEDLIQNGHEEIADSLPLIESGKLTSLQTVELVMFLEERFGVSIDPEEVTEENFRSLATIVRLVESKMEVRR